jgi:hypothetical protein
MHRSEPYGSPRRMVRTTGMNHTVHSPAFNLARLKNVHLFSLTCLYFEVCYKYRHIQLRAKAYFVTEKNLPDFIGEMSGGDERRDLLMISGLEPNFSTSFFCQLL